ncbi:MAG: MMPL family transporter [Muribaculaceae bacterium]|nr:MMPL family transporter [Roseburia sp.]MCM1432172.1 MMPL family transporter [Muribaculaceae bacterium]MCM1492142.1 MMPL family transporter [Muribaculaceae bacterium]
MSKEAKENNVMLKIASFIVDKRNLFFLLFILMMIFSAVAMGWVKVENELAAYLPQTTETRRGLDLMEEEFITYGTAKVMVSNITYEEAGKISEKLSERKDVAMLSFDNSEEHFHNFSALFDITFAYSETDERCLDSLAEIEEELSDYDLYVSTSLGDAAAEQIESEMNVVSVLVAIIVVTVLLLTSQTYAEVPVLLLTFIAAALISMGTNYMLGTISFVSDSVTVVLQLALSIDYAVIFCNRYKEEHEKYDIREADIIALSKAIPEISSSSLTTIGGLIAMMFMQFGIGRDMAVCLIKAIILSLLAVFLLMPGLLMLFGKLMDKTKHKSFIPRIPFVGKFAYLTKYVMPPLFVLALVAAYFVQSGCPFVYGYSQIETPIQSDVQQQKEMIEESFGSSNFVALLVPAGNYEKERKLLRELDACPEVDYCMGLSNTEAMDGYTLTDKLTAREFSELLDLDYEVAQLLYTAYAVNDENYAKIINGLSNYSVPLIDIFMFLYDEVDEGYVTLEDDLMDTLEEAHSKMLVAKNQLQGEKYSRMLVYLTLPEEGEETFAFLDKMHEIAGKHYNPGRVTVVGESTSQYDLCQTFQVDNKVVSIVSILAVLAVLLFTFKSAGMPVLLIAVIQGAIWINFAFPALQQSNLFFMSYLIVSSIQMGANIDYAIVISGRFMELKNVMPKKDAIIETMNFAFPTIITSGSMLALAGILIGQMSSDGAICGIGQCLGRGTIISIIIVMFILPQILLLGEKIIEKTSFTVSSPIRLQKETGLVRVDGRINGQVSGVMIGEFHGIIRGDVNAVMLTGNLEKEKEAPEIEDKGGKDIEKTAENKEEKRAEDE